MKRFATSAAIAVVVVAGSGDRLGACGPYSQTLFMGHPHMPVDPASFARGELAVISPTFSRRYLVQAYRRLTAVAPADDQAAHVKTDGAWPDPTPWLKARETVLKSGGSTDGSAFDNGRDVGQFQSIENCLSDSFLAAAKTLAARVSRYGAASAQVADWIKAQDAVFANCGSDGAPVLPAQADSTDPIVRADRAYQTAAAYFYATDYTRAEALFRAIANDKSSSWQPYGRYLAARALIRHATVKAASDAERADLLARARRDLDAAVADPAQAIVHDSARGLRDLIDARIRPLERLHDVTARLRSRGSMSARDVTDYVYLMDRLVGDVRHYPYDAIAGRDQMIAGDDLTEWIVTLQGTGPSAGIRARERWLASRAPHWLVAALWRISPDDSAAAEILEAAGTVPRSSPAFATVSVLRVRLHIARNEIPAARTALAGLPDAAGPGLPADAVNLLRAERLLVAETFDEWLRASPRVPVLTGVIYESDGVFNADEHERGWNRPTFDVDAARGLSEHMPLARLVEASSSRALPGNLRLKVAIAAWTRAVLLDRHGEARTVAPILRTLAPALAPDLDRYLAATTPAARHRAALLLILRRSGFRPYIRLVEDADTRDRELNRAPVHSYGANWWCAFGGTDRSQQGPYQEYPESRLPDVFGSIVNTSPRFLTAADREAARAEWQQLAALPTAPNYLADQAVAWARAASTDQNAAEALARAVQATRWGCTDQSTGRFSQRAFATLHRLFPKSAWAAQTRYWFSGG